MINITKTNLNKYLKSLISTLFITLFVTSVSYGQDSTDVKEPNEAVSETFNTGIFLENQTYITNPAKSIELVINHRFGKISDGSKELWGIYSPSNIRMGLNYAVTDYLNLGFGTTKYNKQQD